MSEFCDNCGAPNDQLPGDGQTNMCESCGHPIEPEEDGQTFDDPYAF